MRRLYRSVYLAVIASLVAVVVIIGAILRFGPGLGPMNQGADIAAEFVASVLPDASRPREEIVAAIDNMASHLRTDVALYDPFGRQIAASGRPLPPPPPHARFAGFRYDREGATWSLPLPDGRWLVVRALPRLGNPIPTILLGLALVALAVAIIAYPVVRSLTRRIERLQGAVETLAAGELATRVKVEGKDEVARLAAAFNRAAERIEELVGAHRMLLAAASHELRTPLSRLRLGLALLQQDDDPKYRASIEADLAELESLIESILTASRLDALKTVTDPEYIDLLALTAEEAARFHDVNVEGDAVLVRGDATLLRLLIRNLLENAHRHGQPPVSAEVTAMLRGAMLDVKDNGPGVAPADRARIFEPFFQARRDAPGSGLGLALVARIARLHGGNAQVIDSPKGAWLRVTLPGD